MRAVALVRNNSLRYRIGCTTLNFATNSPFEQNGYLMTMAPSEVSKAKKREGTGARAPLKKLALVKRPPDRIPDKASEHVLNHLRNLIQAGKLKPGDRLPAERSLSVALQVSRPTLRAALRSLVAMGILDSRRGSGTYVVNVDTPPVLDAGPLTLMATLRGFTREEMFQARLALETAAAGLAAEHATSEQLTQLAEELTGIFATVDEPEAFLLHDAKFHSLIAEASNNRILAALSGMVVAAMYDFRITTVRHASDLKESAEMHRCIYRAIRKRSPQEARDAMQDHLNRAHRAQRQEVETPAEPNTL